MEIDTQRVLWNLLPGFKKKYIENQTWVSDFGTTHEYTINFSDQNYFNSKANCDHGSVQTAVWFVKRTKIEKLEFWRNELFCKVFILGDELTDQLSFWHERSWNKNFHRFL